jgi:hypothetical protein
LDGLTFIFISKKGWRKTRIHEVNYLDIRKDSRLDVEALATCSISSCHKVGTRINSQPDVPQNLAELLAINLDNIKLSLLNVQVQFFVQLTEATLNLQ